MKELSIEEKQLLLKDLCARLPCHTIVSTGEEDLELVKVDILNGLVYIFSESFLEFDVFKIKPYLRSMSGMTEEEKKEAKENGCIIYWDTSPEDKGLMIIASQKGFDWLNKKMFDYRGLIPMGLALEASKGMYKT